MPRSGKTQEGHLARPGTKVRKAAGHGAELTHLITRRDMFVGRRVLLWPQLSTWDEMSLFQDRQMPVCGG